MNRHGTGSVDSLIPGPAPAHRDEYADVIRMLPLVSCLMSHFEKELSSEHLNN